MSHALERMTRALEGKPDIGNKPKLKLGVEFEKVIDDLVKGAGLNEEAADAFRRGANSVKHAGIRMTEVD